MIIVIIGAGKIGVTLTEQLAHEGHDITVIDSRPEALADIGNRLDIMTVEGNGIAPETQKEMPDRGSFVRVRPRYPL